MVATRLVARLRGHDWLAVIVELVVVVLGILIALQVNNWNQARIDRARATAYSARIHAELLTDNRNMGVTLALWEQVAAYGRAAIACSDAVRLATTVAAQGRVPTGGSP